MTDISPTGARIIRRIVVTGGRGYDRRTPLHAALEDYPDLTHLAQGGATGADHLAREWAKRRPNVQMATYAADWKGQGKKAGPLRNQRMLEDFRPDLVLACPGGAGTADCVARAKLLGIPVRSVDGG